MLANAKHRSQGVSVLKTSSYLIAFALSLMVTLAAANDRTPPASWTLERSGLEALNGVDQDRFSALDLETIASEDASRESIGEPPRFAWAHATSIRTDQRGSWDVIDDIHIWRFHVHAEDATLTNFGLHNVHLPAGSRLYIYSPKAAAKGQMDRHAVIGPYDQSINRSHGEFWTPNLQGDQAIIEVNVPAAMVDQFTLEIAQVSHGYRGFGDSALAYRQNLENREGDGKQACREEGGTRSGACNQDVACLSDDDPWNDPRRSVGAYSRSGTMACTGSLVNNTAQDQRMLFITARHCISEAQASSIVVYWNYEWPTCRRPGASGGTSVNPPDPNITNSGGTFLASTSNPFGGNCTASDECSDVYLLELNDPANPDFDLHWSGWDRRPPPTVCAQGPGVSTDGLCATIHHPGVHEKRITWVAQDMQVGNIAGAQNIHWHPFWHPNPPELPNMPDGAPATIPPAVTEPGSSGSPLYTADRRFIGVLSGGPAFCGATGTQLSDFYGGLWHAWDGMGTSTTRMRDHLDPQGTAPMFIDGTDGDGFLIEPAGTSFSQCGFADVDISLEISASGEFKGDVDLSTSNLPVGVSAGFSVNPVTVPGSSVLTLSNLDQAGAGPFDFLIDGNSGEFDNSTSISLTLTNDDPGTPIIASPGDGQGGLSTTPTITWSAADQAVGYEVEVASDMGFSNIIFSAETSQTEVTVSPSLTPNTQYFVRVRANNDCGMGDWSATTSFTTANEICVAPGIAIPDNNATGITSDLELADGGELLGLEMSLDITHTWVGDLIIRLTHVDSGTMVTLVERPGQVDGSGFGCSGDNIQTGVSDDAPVSLQSNCISASVAYPEPAYSPNDPLANFTGLDPSGVWRLSISDNAGGDLGTLNEWCLMPAVDGPAADEVFDDRFEALD
jgi:lysyl endopeptidase